MPNPLSFRYFKTSPEIIQFAVMLYVRFPLSLRNVEDVLHESGVDVSYLSVPHMFGSQVASQIKSTDCFTACHCGLAINSSSSGLSPSIPFA